MYVLGGESLVVHEQKVDISGIVDNKGFVAGGHQMPGFLVGTVPYLNDCRFRQRLYLVIQTDRQSLSSLRSKQHLWPQAPPSMKS